MYEYQRICIIIFTDFSIGSPRGSRRSVKYRQLCQSQRGGTEQSHGNPRDHRSNFSKAHRTRFKIGRTPGTRLCKNWSFLPASPF